MLIYKMGLMLLRPRNTLAAKAAVGNQPAQWTSCLFNDL
jgi:hypothetical protein